MDPFSRRSTWNLLKVRCQTHHHVTRHYRACLLNVLLGIAYVQSKAKGRIMVLTTHFMDEADLLGDRIGIMSDGALRRQSRHDSCDSRPPGCGAFGSKVWLAHVSQASPSVAAVPPAVDGLTWCNGRHLCAWLCCQMVWATALRL